LLICCDGCANAFHFKCCDPPKDNTPEELEDPYFCHECRARDAPETNGSVSPPLLSAFDARNTSSFQLPEDYQGYFAGVKGHPNGEYTTTTDRVNKYVSIFLRNYAV
jgi:hypothetical protein